MAACLRPPGPKSPIPGAVTYQFLQDPLGFFRRLQQEYGDVAYCRLGPRHVYLLSHPDLVKDSLATHAEDFARIAAFRPALHSVEQSVIMAEGEAHARQRRFLYPAFSHEHLQGYAAIMGEEAGQLRESWHDGAVLDVHAAMMQATSRIAARTLFGCQPGAELAEVAAALNVLFTDGTKYALYRFLPLGAWLRHLPLAGAVRLKRAETRLQEIISYFIQSRRRERVPRSDVLSLLLHALDSEQPGDGFSESQVRDECLFLFLAGHETTANLLSWTLYLLAQHPVVAAKLRAEVDGALDGSLPGFRELGQLPYTEMVVSESMRLYPPVWCLGRDAVEDYQAGGYTIPRGSIIVCSQWVGHRDARFYPNPDVFDPQHWTPEARARRPKYAFFPFGAGPRQCIGEGFAKTEAVLMLAALLQRWEFELLPHQTIVPNVTLTLRPRYGVQMRLHRRQPTVQVAASVRSMAAS